jgi:NDP-4-keto-2,6-dideoxyhexose 3-C-methyltransferase
MPTRVISKCLLCGNPDLKPILDLGKQPLSSVFPRPGDRDPSVSPLELVRCNTATKRDGCGLVQLRHIAELTEMYGKTYGYFSSISPTMVEHLASKIPVIESYTKLGKGDVVLDIGCNDGTLLNAYGAGRGLTRIGMDPSAEKFKASYQRDIRVVYDFFSEKGVRSLIGDAECKVITSIAMFYDLEDPLGFMKQVRALLAKDGVWMLELSYFPLLCTQLTYDQICHEHLTYFSLSHMQWMVKKADMRILDVTFNDINGGSFALVVGREDGPHKANSKKIDQILAEEAPLDTAAPYKRLHNRVIEHREEIRHFFELTGAAGKRVYGYGASTKGNIVLNYCGITAKDLIAIGDRNPEKDGLTTPGTHIPIVAHSKLPKDKADYLFVFIWHFRKEVIRDEVEYLKGGGKLVFDLPRLHVVDKNNYERYLASDFDDQAYLL